MKGSKERAYSPKDERSRINLRPVLFCALGLVFGIFLYGRIRFGGLAPSDFLLLLIFLGLTVRPASFRRAATVFLCLLLGAAAGVGMIHGYSASYFTVAEEGVYTLSGTASSVTAKSGYTSVILSDVFLNGEAVKGKCSITLGEEVAAGDVLVATAKLTPVDIGLLSGYTSSLFASNIRYTASASEYEVVGQSSNVLLRLNAALFRSLYAHMDRDEASLAYALLTGNSGVIDGGLVSAVRQSGIAHIFAVSGLHIGILFSAAYMLCRPLGRRRWIPALLLAVAYSAFCGFSVSSVRAVLMCGVLGISRAVGRKSDLIESVSLAAVVILLLMPAQFYSAGFRLSFGACIGLALFSGSFSRAFARIRLPKALCGYLSASLSVQIFTFPVLLEAFGYFPVWGPLVNLVAVPFVGILFPFLIICAALALIIAPAASFFLVLPAGILSVLLYVFSVVDFSLVAAGFSLGAGAVVWLAACVVLSQRVRLGKGARSAAALVLGALFCVCVVTENVVFSGCRITVYGQNGNAVLIRTSGESVLVIDGDITLSACEDFLARNYGGRLDCVVILSENETAAINVAAFLNASAVYAKEETETGLRQTNVQFSEEITCGSLALRYEGESKLTLTAEGLVVELDFTQNAALSADLFIGGASGDLNFYLKDGIIKSK